MNVCVTNVNQKEKTGSLYGTRKKIKIKCPECGTTFYIYIPHFYYQENNSDKKEQIELTESDTIYLSGKVKKIEDSDNFTYTVRSNKYDFHISPVKEREFMDRIFLRNGQNVILSGTLNPMVKGKVYTCPYCGHVEQQEYERLDIVEKHAKILLDYPK